MYKLELKYNNIGGDDDIEVWEVLRAYSTIHSAFSVSSTVLLILSHFILQLHEFDPWVIFSFACH